MKRQGGFGARAAGTILTFGAGALLNFIVGIVLSRVLGPEGKGIVTPALSTATIAIAVAALGLDNSVAYFLDKKSFTARDVLLTSLLFAVLTGAVSFAGTRIVFEFIIPETTSRARFFFAGGVLFTVIYTVTQSALLGRNRIGLINIGKLAGDFTRTILAILFLYWLWPTVEGFAFAYMAAQAINAILASGFAWSEVGVGGARLDFKFLGKAIGFGIAVFFATLTVQTNRQIGVLILKVLKSTEQTGIYSQAQTFVNQLLLVPQALSLTLYGAVVGKKGKEEFTARTVRLSLLFLLVLSGITAMVAPWLIPLLFTDKFAPSVPYLWGLLPSVVVYALPQMYASFVIASWGKPWFVFGAGILGLGINAALNLTLVPHIGAWGTVIAFNASALAMTIYYVILLIGKGGMDLRHLLIPSSEDFRILTNSLKKNR